MRTPDGTRARRGADGFDDLDAGQHPYGNPGRGPGARGGPGAGAGASPGSCTHWSAGLPVLVIGWSLAYGALRTYWAFGHRPWFPPIGPDLLAFSGWGVVVLCAAAAVVALAIRLLLGSLGVAGRDEVAGPTRAAGWVAVVLAWVVAAALTSAACLLLLDLVGLLFVGIGMRVDAGALLSRAGCMAGAVLVGTTALAAGRRLRDGCPGCGRAARRTPGEPIGTGTVEGTGRAPWWAFAAGYAAVLGCLVRFGAQALVGFGSEAAPATGNAGKVAGLAFLAAAALAGTLLPLAQAHRFGRVWPRWVLGLAGRRVPRWLVLGPGLGVSVGMTAYFGTGLVQLLTEPARAAGADPYPSWFMGVAMSAYLVWGVGLGVAALSYRLLTRPRCGWCGAPAG